MSKRHQLNQVGDTIVEVLLAVIVVGLAIGLGYGVASRALRANQQAQERVAALKEVESQVERLKQRAAEETNPNGGVFAPGSYCLTDTPEGRVPIDDVSENVNDDPLTTEAYGGGACVNGIYHVSITPASSGDTKQFNIRARWFLLGEGDKQETNITYRVYPTGGDE